MNNAKHRDTLNNDQRDNALEICDNGDTDPINAYFKQRHSKSIGSSIYSRVQSDCSSSLEVLDIDNISLLDDMDRFTSVDAELQSNWNAIDKPCENLQIFNRESVTKHSKPHMSESELNLAKQRKLARQALIQLNSRLEKINENLKSLDIEKIEPIQPNMEQDKKFSSGGGAKQWFELNQSPQTPRFFKDELKSLSGSSPISPWKKSCARKSDIFSENVKRPQSFSEISFEPNYCSADFRNSDLNFKAESTVDVLNRLEEDEKKFIKEQSILSNNSAISHFSGLMGEEEAALGRPSAVLSKSLDDHERISIGKYFQLRSHSVNSLIGAKNAEDNFYGAVGTNKTNLPLSSSFDFLEVPVRDVEVVRSSVMSKKQSRKNGEESRSSYSSERVTHPNTTSQSTRYSNESSESTSTLLIQNLLCNMDSGLSGTQINDCLLEHVGKIKNQRKYDNGEMARHADTPKPMRISGEMSSKKKQEKSGLNVNGRNSRDESDAKSSIEVLSDDVMPKSLSKSHIKENKNLVQNRIKNTNGFDSSTPKSGSNRPEMEKFKFACSKLRVNDADWEPPRISSISKKIIFNDPDEENEKTLVLNKTGVSSDADKNDKTVIESNCAEDSQELTIALERLSEIRESSLLNDKSDHADNILSVVREVVNYPKGSIDFSALTPVLRNRFPDLLSQLPVNENSVGTANRVEDVALNVYDLPVTSSESWISISLASEYKDRVNTVVGMKKDVFIHAKNMTREWIILSVESISVQSQSGKLLMAKKSEDKFFIETFLIAQMKDILIPPGEKLPCKLYITPKVSMPFQVKLELRITKLSSKDNRTQDLVIPIACVSLTNIINIIPNKEVDFGVMPVECCDERNVKIIFDGVCDLPVKIYIEESQHFYLSSELQLNNERIITGQNYDSKNVCYVLKEGKKSVLEFKINFRPNLALYNKISDPIDVKETLVVALDANTESPILQKIRIVGRLVMAKFLCNSSASTLVFRSTEIGQVVKREFPIKNVGPIDIEFSLCVLTDVSNPTETTDSLFSVPKTFTVPQNEERSIEVVFNGLSKDNCNSRHLQLQLMPNGRISYEVQLLGIIMPPPPTAKSLSRASSQSGPSHSVNNPENIVFKLKTTANSICWAAVPLDVEQKHTFHIMNTSNCNTTARFSFRKETSVFKFINDNGEVIEKLRKVLKPNCSNSMTVLFRPDCVGPHTNCIVIETNHLSRRRVISLNGYGGAPKIITRNLKSDLNGSKIIRLVNSEPENRIFYSTIEFINKGNIPGFVSIRKVMKVLSLSSGLEVNPSNFVLQPNSRTEVTISQKLKNDDIKRLLSGRDIGKLAILTVTTGDEHSRLRFRRLAKDQKVKPSENISWLLNKFNREFDEQMDNFDDDKSFENVFRRSLETIEIAAIVERHADIYEPTILEDFEETVEEFVTILPANDYSIASPKQLSNRGQLNIKSTNMNKSSASTLSGAKSRDSNISRWLASIEKH